MMRSVVSLPKAKELPNIFTLSNGASLRFRFISHKNPDFFMTWHPGAWRPNKNDLVLGLQTARQGRDPFSPRSDLQLICADFDYLPPGFYGYDVKESWSKFRDFLERLFKDKGIVLKSRTGKAKVFFCVHLSEIDESYQPTTQDGRRCLSSILPDYLLEYADLRYSAMFHSFLTKGMVTALSSRLPGLAPVASLDTTYTTKGTDQGKELRALHKSIVTPRGFEWFVKNSVAREKVIRVLLETRSLLRDKGFDLVQAKIAEAAGVTQYAVSKMLKQLQEAGYLECIDDKWQKGKKAKTYRALGRLAEALKDLASKCLPIAPSSLPDEIKDGQWQETLWKVSYRFVRDPVAFLEWAGMLPGVRRRDRWRQAIRAIMMRLRYAGFEFREKDVRALAA